MEEDKIKYSNIFNQNLEKNVNEMLAKKSQIMQEEINKKLTDYNELFSKEQKNAYNSINDYNDILNNIKDETEEMGNAIKELCELIRSNELLLISKENFNKIICDKNLQISEIKNDNFQILLGNILIEKVKMIIFLTLNLKGKV